MRKREEVDDEQTRGAIDDSRRRAVSLGARRVGDAPFDEIFHPIAERLLERCDGILRIGGASQGADLMVRVARERGLAVYDELRDVPGCEDAQPTS